MSDVDDGSSVTLVFYRVADRWWSEPWLNVVAAAAQFSSLTHVELAIGEESGAGGQMSNVVRIYNDNAGVELVERTGKNPKYTYLQLGCSKAAVNRMLRFAHKCKGLPFSNIGMARSLLWPRTTDHRSYFCAELVAAVLKEGGLMDTRSNPGAATPELLHRMYRNRASVTANPYTLRAIQTHTGMAPTTPTTHAHGTNVHATIGTALASQNAATVPTNNQFVTAPRLQAAISSTQQNRLQGATAARMEKETLLKHRALVAPVVQPTGLRERRSGDSPPRGRFVCVSAPQAARTNPSHNDIGLTLNSISFNKR